MVSTPRGATGDSLADLQQIAGLGERMAGAGDERALAEICTAATGTLLGARVVAFVTETVSRCHPAQWDDVSLTVLRNTSLAALAVAGRPTPLDADSTPPAVAEWLAKGGGGVLMAAPLRQQRSLVGALVAALPADSPRVRAMMAALAQLASGALATLRMAETFREHARDLERQLDRRNKELKAAEHQLIASDRMATLGMLAAGIGHEISNPLATVMLNNGALTNRLARAGLPAAPLTEAQRLLAENDEALDRIRSIVGELRTFARKDDETRQPLDLRAIVESSIRLCRAQLRGIEVKLELPMLPVVRGSSARLGQVLLNLLVNAAHALAATEKPRISVTAATHGDEVAVTVTDNGPGVPPELQQRVFDMFFTTKGPGEGTGLGLGIAKDIAERHGGRLELESRPGAGASFKLVLPVRVIESTETRPRSPSSPAIKPARRKPSIPSLPAQKDTPGEPRPRVLIVDDEIMILRALERELAIDFDVVAVSSGDEAVAAWSKSRFDAVLCDVNLVGESGLDVSVRLAALEPTCAQRTIFMSGGPSSAKVRETVAAAPGRFVSKPFDMTALVKLIRQLTTA